MIWEFSTWSLFKHYFPARVILHYLSANFSIPDFSSFMCLKNESDWKLNNRIIKDGITISDSNSSWFFTTILSNSTYLLQSMSLFWSYNQYLVQFSSVTQSHPTLCDPMNHSTPGLPVHHQLPEFTQTHVHRVCDAIQPSHPRSSPSPHALNPSQHQSLFQWVNSSHEVAKVLEFQL